MFRNNSLEGLTNCQNDNQYGLFVGSGRSVCGFDIRKEGILVDQLKNRSEGEHFDDLSYIKVNPIDGVVGAADDEGDTRLYNYDLECVELLDQGHSNIVNAIEYVPNEKGTLCITGGFDSRLLHWRLGEGKVVK